jgi:hypothetical protein
MGPADKEETRMMHVHLLLAFRWGRIRMKILIRFYQGQGTEEGGNLPRLPLM